MSSSDNEDTPSATTTTTPSIDLTPLYDTMTMMTEMMAAQAKSQQETMYTLMSQAPTATAKADPDFNKRADDLKAKIAADYTKEAAARRGRESTILTTPLTDEPVALTDSVLTGK